MPGKVTNTLVAAGALALATPAHAGNIAACEAVVMMELENGAATMASFFDASEFIASVMDPDTPALTEIEGRPVSGLMCTRRSVVPTADDIPLIRSGVPFVISTDFDSADGATVNIVLDENGKAFALMAAGLSEADEAALDAFLDTVPPVEMDTGTAEAAAEVAEEGASGGTGDGSDDANDTSGDKAP